MSCKDWDSMHRQIHLLSTLLERWRTFKHEQKLLCHGRSICRNRLLLHYLCIQPPRNQVLDFRMYKGSLADQRYSVNMVILFITFDITMHNVLCLQDFKQL